MASNANGHAKVQFEMESVSSNSNPTLVSIIGTGEFGRALGRKISQMIPKSSVKLVFGSRNPTSDPIYFVGLDQPVEIWDHEEAFTKSDIIIVAVPSSSYKGLPLNLLHQDQVLIDCSNTNQKRSPTEMSNAEILNRLSKDSSKSSAVPVVKAFNVLSSYSLSLHDPGRRTIPIAADDARAKEVVSDLIRKLGFIADDRGSLNASRQIEAIPHRKFDTWHLPLLISTSVWIFFFIFVVLRSFCSEENGIAWNPKEAIRVLRLVNKACDNHALGMLALCYLPGVLAAYLQLYRGTKYSAFPSWLDRWMRMRKQFGLLMMLSASIHACAYLLTFNIKRETVEIPIWIENENKTDLILSKTVKVETTEKKETLLLNAYLLAGVIAFASTIILGIVSLPSVSKSLSWQEFRFIQSRLGWFCLICATLHCIFKGWASIIQFSCGWIPSSTQMPLYLPAITILLKLPLLIPMVDSRLTKIRAGLIQKK